MRFDAASFWGFFRFRGTWQTSWCSETWDSSREWPKGSFQKCKCHIRRQLLKEAKLKDFSSFAKRTSSQNECFYPRVFQHETAGKINFSELRSFKREFSARYRETCLKRGHLEFVLHWGATLADVTSTHSNRTIRKPSTLLLHTCYLTNPVALLLFIWGLQTRSSTASFKHRVKLQSRNIQQDANNHRVSLVLMGGIALHKYALRKPHRRDSNQLLTEVF